MSSPGQADQDEREPVRVRDNRKIDRDQPVDAAADGADAPSAEGAAAAADVQEETPDTAENTVAAARDDLPDEPSGKPSGDASDKPADAATVPLEDLQRLSAEYTNYRRRAERERQAAGDQAVGRVLADLLPVVDDLERARAHGDLTGPLKAVSDKLDGVFAKAELVAFGAVGDPFDPNLHEAVLHDESDEVTVPTCTTVMRQGYRYKDRVIRAAMVGVSDPADPSAASDSDSGPEPAEAEAPDDRSVEEQQ